MPGERAIIETMNRLLPQGRRNRCHEADCEIIELAGRQYLFTTDEFSAEDRFVESDPRSLGWNIAAGALSDVYACGGRPLYYAHALTASPLWDERFIAGLANGIAQALEASGATFIGGDCGVADAWRCTATVIGECDGVPTIRLGAKPGDGIYITGRIGNGNLMAAIAMVAPPAAGIAGLHRVRFPIRARESSVIRRFASACIDTSDGTWKALSILANLNGCGYAIEGIPYPRTGVLAAKAARLPSLMLFMGECGEYELLCTVPPDREQAFMVETRKAGIRLFRLGAMTPERRTVADGNRTLDLGGFRIEARAFPRTRDYLAALTGWYAQQEGNP